MPLRLNSGAQEILDFFKKNGYINILASNKTGEILRNEANVLKVNHYFDRIIGAQDTSNDKPSKAFTDVAIKDYQPEKIISIGDGKSDIQMAHNYQNGVAVLVWSNPLNAEFDQDKPDFVSPDLLSLKKILTF